MCGVTQAASDSKKEGQAIVRLATSNQRASRLSLSPEFHYGPVGGRCGALSGVSQNLRALKGHCSPRVGLLLVYNQKFSI